MSRHEGSLPGIVVTGAAGGIGVALCKRLLERSHAHVIAADRREQLGIVKSVFQGHQRLSSVAVDVADPDSVQALSKDDALSGPLRGLVNLAGTEGTVFGPVHELSREEFRSVLDVNLVGAFDVCRVLLPALLETGNASIVNVASVAGLVAFRDQSPYVASKHGMVGLTRALALDYARQGLRANCVCPGFVATPMMARVENALGGDATADRLRQSVPTGRYVGAEEVAAAIEWLLLDSPTSLIGATLTVDGGWTLK